MNSQYSIRECLRGYTESALGTICERWELVAGTKPARIRAIEKVLSDPLHARRALKELDAAELRIVNLVAEQGALLVSDVVSVPGLLGDGHTREALRVVTERGLVLACPSERNEAFCFAHLPENGRGGTPAMPLTVPDAVASQLPPAPPLGIRLTPVEYAAEPDVSGSAEPLTAAFLETLRLIDLLGPRFTAAGKMHKADANRIHAAAAEAGVSSDQVELALMMARELRCAVVKNGRLKTTPTVAQWATSGPSARVKSLFDVYMASRDIPELEVFFPQLRQPLQEHLPVGGLRRTYHKMLFARILREQDAGVWFSVDGLIAVIHGLDRNVLFLEEQWRCIASHTRDGNPAWKNRSWQAHEARLFGWMIRTLLAGAGIVELGDGGSLFRITPLGRYVFGQGPAPTDAAPAESDALVVQANYEVIVYLDRCPAELRWRLDTFCDRIRGEKVAVYRLTQDGMCRGVRAGLSAGGFLGLLEAHSRRPVPENVREELRTWERKLESVALRTNCCLVECASAAQADTLARGLPDSRRIGKRFVLRPRGPEDARGRAADLLVAATELDYAQPLPACLEQENGLTLRASWGEWNLLLKRRLEEIGDVTVDRKGDLRLRLVREKAGTVKDWGLVAAQLEAYAKGPLGARYRGVLRAWSGEAGPARSSSATLLRFDDAELCDAVLELPDAAALLEGRLGLYTVMVRKGALSKLKQMLRAYGVGAKPAKGAEGDAPPEDWVSAWVERRKSAEEPTEREGSAVPQAQAAVADREPALPSYPPRIIREILEDAIERRKPVLLQYQSRWSDQPTLRRVNPVAVDVYGPSPSLCGYCHRHGGARTFRLARVVGIRVVEDETF